MKWLDIGWLSGTDGLARGAQNNKMLRAGFWGGRLLATACTVVLTKGRALCTALLGHILPQNLHPFRKGRWSLLQSFRAEKTEFHGYKTGRPWKAPAVAQQRGCECK